MRWDGRRGDWERSGPHDGVVVHAFVNLAGRAHLELPTQLAPLGAGLPIGGVGPVAVLRLEPPLREGARAHAYTRLERLAGCGSPRGPGVHVHERVRPTAPPTRPGLGCVYGRCYGWGEGSRR